MTQDTTFTVSFPNNTVAKKWLGQEFMFKPEGMSESWKRRIFEYGLRVVNDAMNSQGMDLPSDKMEFLRDMVAEINSGAEWEGRSRGGSNAMSDVDKRAYSLAKDALKMQFKLATGKTKIADMCAASDKVAAYFKDNAWIDAKVKEYIDGQKASGKHDYMAIAARQLEEEKQLAASVVFDF